jgi:hypothetical protein
MTAALLTAVVRKNRPLERRTIHDVGAPVRWISQPPIASPPTPPPGSSAPDAIDVHASGRLSRAGTRSKNSRKITTKPAQEATSSATAAMTHPGLMSRISRATGRSAGTASSSEIASAPSSAAVARRVPILGLPTVTGDAADWRATAPSRPAAPASATAEGGELGADEGSARRRFGGMAACLTRSQIQRLLDYFSDLPLCQAAASISP